MPTCKDVDLLLTFTRQDEIGGNVLASATCWPLIISYTNGFQDETIPFYRDKALLKMIGIL